MASNKVSGSLGSCARLAPAAAVAIAKKNDRKTGDLQWFFWRSAMAYFPSVLAGCTTF
jgi:hypothetical protein